MDTKQPEALRLAHIFEHPLPPEWSDMVAATKELRRQHAENETLRAGLDAARLEIESLQKAATGRHALQATGAHPAPCARHCEAQAFRITLSNLHAENERLRTCNDNAQHEIANLQGRVQQLGKAARDVNSRRVQELEARLAAVGAGGVEPLRRRECLHQISEPAQLVALDAARYRWVKEQAEFFPLVMDGTGLLCANAEEAEAEIDAAIAAKQEGTNG